MSAIITIDGKSCPFVSHEEYLRRVDANIESEKRNMKTDTLTADQVRDAVNEVIDPLRGAMLRLEHDLEEAKLRLRPASERAADKMAQRLTNYYKGGICAR